MMLTHRDLVVECLQPLPLLLLLDLQELVWIHSLLLQVLVIVLVGRSGGGLRLADMQSM